jgi:DNA-binding transcriptional ArsR family regulator
VVPVGNDGNGNGSGSSIKLEDAKVVVAAFRAMTHPLRPAILSLLKEHGKRSPSQLHVELKQPLGNVSYHVRCLYEARLLKSEGTRPRRGAVEHFYSLTAFGEAVLAFTAEAQVKLAESAPPKRGAAAHKKQKAAKPRARKAAAPRRAKAAAPAA